VLALTLQHDGGHADRQGRAQAKYAEERAKRLRPDGNEQYLQLKDQLAHYLEDPYTPRSSASRRPTTCTFAFIGGGFAGLVTGARLKEAGVDDVRIIEKGGDFGGTWYWNRYPGAQCDTGSFVYMPLLEETGHMPTEKYAHAPEILEHCQRIGKQYDLYDNALFHTEVTDLEWDDDRSRWIIRTNRGDEFTAAVPRHGHRAAARARSSRASRARGLRRPLVPHQPLGLRLHRRRPRGRADGQARRQAGGDHRHRRHVGAGGAPPRQGVRHPLRRPAHAELGRRARQPPTDPEWFATINTPGWQQRWLENFTANQTGGMAEEDLVMDGWTDLSRRIRSRIMSLPPEEFTPRG
jgi:cyclohexanone monooxygenase